VGGQWGVVFNKDKNIKETETTKMKKKGKDSSLILSVFVVASIAVFMTASGSMAQETVKQRAVKKDVLHLPQLREKQDLVFAPHVPPPITRNMPAVVEVHMTSTVKRMEIKSGVHYDYWTFNDHVPGPFIRARHGDTLEIHHSNTDASGMPHNVDFHAVTGPGGGAPITTVVKGEERIAWFKLLHPGLFIYHCAAPPVMDHIANGMYGLILVEPKDGLPKVDKEFYVLQSEIYGEFEKTEENPIEEDDFWKDDSTETKIESGLLLFSHQNGLDEHPKYIFFNGAHNRHVGDGSLKAKVGDRVRIFFGNIGPNLISSFHIIGEIFDNPR